MKKEMKKILVTGSVGQIGSELTMELRNRYGAENVIATGRKTQPSEELKNSGPFHFINVNDINSIEEIVKKYDIDTVYHMAAILSAVGEKNPQLCWDVNMNGTINLLELGIKYEMARIIIPSSIAVWGAGVPLDNTPQESVLKPSTMYGVTKVCGELLCDYYVQRFGLDIRGLRYPGIISYETLPGGGTTDYAVAIYYEAVDKGEYTCFVKEDTRLPMMYMPDAIEGTIQLAEADFDKLIHHSDFNHAAMSFSVTDLADSIRKRIPDFKVGYEPDYRQAIADSWPNSIDDSAAQEEWGWKPKWDLDAMTDDMLKHLRERKEAGTLYR
ncbi:MAG: NAD-dependent epimerase/dehydratase family protein [Candidatus Electryonea clarkiae]|nr:NAD-dependent epimerase/dehydratase family protein [Candidatus Electryonea clarkiae]MDP8287408.1 NAD-dependent epimerase/dehydratase family protein [Candidatus Electryonea clarkiae]